jgi:hypothetical protein
VERTGSDAPAPPSWAVRIVQDNIRCALAPALTRFPSHYLALEARVASAAAAAPPAAPASPLAPWQQQLQQQSDPLPADEESLEDAVMRHLPESMGEAYRAATAGRDTV